MEDLLKWLESILNSEKTQYYRSTDPDASIHHKGRISAFKRVIAEIKAKASK